MSIATDNLTKDYGKNRGCRNVSIEVKKGELFGFLGPNGAGKSTFTKMLVGLLFPTGGSGSVLGRPLGDVSVREKIGYLPENFKYQDWMTGVDLLSFHADLFRLDKKIKNSRIYEVLELVNLKGNEKYKIGTYSKGMQQRIGLACALLPDPELLFLDEPSSALDPIGRKEVRDIMVSIKEQGKTVFLNSHLLSEVEMICDSVAIINKGNIIKKGKTEELLEKTVNLEITCDNISDDLLKILKSLDQGCTYYNSKLSLKLENKKTVADAARLIVENGGNLYEMALKKDSLEKVFIELIEGKGVPD